MRLAAATASSSEEKVAIGRDRPEDLLAERARLGRHIGEDGRLEEVAATRRGARRR